jgi:hypothetical protein
MVRLERLGVATAAVATQPFVDEALQQARLLAMPDYRMVYIPHPVQLLTVDELHKLADRAWPEILARLTAGGAPPRPMGGGSSGRRTSA